jgi:hypothetical protein
LADNFGVLGGIAFTLVLKKMAEQLKTIAVPIDDDLWNEYLVRENEQ